MVGEWIRLCEYVSNSLVLFAEGRFTIPEFVSDGARDLLKAMLVVDPVKRITIAEIRQSSWFQTDLPDYLRPLPELEEEFALSRLDRDIVRQLQDKMLLSEDVIRASISKKPIESTPEERSIRVAYQLAWDSRHILSGGE